MLFAQNNKRVIGSVTDTSKTALSDVNIMLIAGKDTLRTVSAEDGYFSFSKIKSETFLLKVTAIGYQDFSRSYSFGKEKQLEIKELVLKLSSNTLKEVVVKAKPNPIRIMQDTIEYNAAAYQVLEGDNVADLLKQFPGLNVDEEYNVTTMGKEMVKLRVNGKDFFTNNVKDFISKLPAAIVAKIQVIDDYGDEANFTGIKTGEPIKMLNIVTKTGMDKGKFGAANASGGTNDQLGASGNLNLWNGNKQSGGSLNYTTRDNGAGESQNKMLTANHRISLGKNANVGLSYNFGGNNNAFKNEQAIETLNPLGTFYNNSLSTGQSKSDNHNLNSNFNFNNKKYYINGSFGLSYNVSDNLNTSFNSQSGVIRQDLNNNNQSKSKSPMVFANMGLSKILKNAKSSLLLNIGMSSSTNSSNMNISTNTLYYNKDTKVLEKDSLLSRNLLSENNSQGFNLNFSYNVGLKKPKDSLARHSLSFNYNGSINRGSSDISTFVLDNKNKNAHYVDSLSTNYTSLVINQSLGINYNYSNKNTRYSFGFNARPSLLSNNYINLHQKINNHTLNYSPSINLSKTIAKGKILSINYSGSNNNPTLNQLQPIRNTQNLQNIVIGNPNLKPTFQHNISSNYNYVHNKSGISLQTGLNFSTIQNEIVSNVILLTDTLNSLKQETRFENTNGNYNLRSNYNLNIPIKKNKYSISYSGSMGLSNRAVFINNQKSFNKGINLSQNVNGAILLKMVSFNTGASYSFTSNSNAVNLNSINDITLIGLGQINGATFFKTHNFRVNFNGSLRLKKLSLNTSLNYSLTHNDTEFDYNNVKNIKNLNVSFSTRATIKKTYQLGLNAAKQINKGYALSNTNPLIINANFSKRFLKNQSLSLTINANDLLNQGNNLARYVSGNSIIDSRTNQVTRVFTFGLNYNISNFGGRNFRVDPD